MTYTCKYILISCPTEQRAIQLSDAPFTIGIRLTNGSQFLLEEFTSNSGIAGESIEGLAEFFEHIGKSLRTHTHQVTYPDIERSPDM